MWRCRVDYYELFAPKCGGCGHPISEQFITALNQQWHTHCFVCAVSSTLLTLSADACMGGVILPLPQLQPIPSPLSQRGLDTAIPPNSNPPRVPVPNSNPSCLPCPSGGTLPPNSIPSCPLFQWGKLPPNSNPSISPVSVQAYSSTSSTLFFFTFRFFLTFLLITFLT